MKCPSTCYEDVWAWNPCDMEIVGNIGDIWIYQCPVCKKVVLEHEED